MSSARCGSTGGKHTWRGDMAALRAALGIPPEVYADFAQLRRKVLDKAKAEIDQLAHFRVEWREIRQGRAVAEVEFRFRSRRVRRRCSRRWRSWIATRGGGASGGMARSRSVVTGQGADSGSAGKGAMPKAEAEEVTFPSRARSGIDAELSSVARQHGGGWDVDLIAAGFRETMGERLAKLRGVKLIASWKGFCESWVTRRGRA